jgi:putative transcriptional regulator
MAESQWLSGSFLISDVNLSDPHFRRTVVLLISHDENGAFGFVVNRQLDATLSDAMPDFADTEPGKLPLFEGGPVQPQYLFAIHSGLPGEIRSEHAVDPIEHVTFEPAFQVLMEYLKTEWPKLPENARPPVHLYAGYSGWEGGQLENELKHNAWIVRPAAAKYIFSDTPEEGWREALGELGGMHRIIAETGYKPSMN